VTISVKVTDDNDVNDVNLYWSDGTNEYTEEMSLGSGSIYTSQIGPFSVGATVIYSIDATDNNDQLAQTGIFSFTVMKLTTVEDIENSEETGVDGVDMITMREYETVEVNIEKIEPTEIPTQDRYIEEENEIIYSYLDIIVEADDIILEDDDIDQITIKFKVALEWIDENNVDKEQITLMRYHGGSWENLPTILVSEDSINAYYEATASGTSTFAITGVKIVEIPDDDDDSGGTGVPWIFIILAIVAVIIVVLLVMFKMGYLYVEEKNKPYDKRRK